MELISRYLFTTFVATLIVTVFASPFDSDQVDFNLNQNKAAGSPLEYSGEWPNHTYNPSPTNWRFPFYTFFLDR